jgi:hypothetical protein
VHALWWATHDAQAVAPTLDYAPLSQSARAAAEAQIKRVTLGGQPILQ